MIHENKYTNDYVLKSTKNSAIKSKRKNMKTCPVQLLVQAATESYLIHCATNNGTLVILVSFNLSGECISISTAAVIVATKLGRMVTYLEGFLTIKFNILIKWSCKVM